MRRILCLAVLAACSSSPDVANNALNTAENALTCDQTVGSPATWAENEAISPCGRPNPLGLPDAASYAQAGQEHAKSYPVEITGVLIPYRAMRAMMEGETDSFIRKILAKLYPIFSGIHGMDGIYDMLGLPHGEDGTRWGLSIIDTPQGEGMTFSCATCHTGELFGKAVFGLPNRKSRANALFVTVGPAMEAVHPWMFDLVAGATDGEKQMYTTSRDNMRYIHSLEPQAQGLDAALAHTMLSLARREPDAWATKGDSWKHPRYTPLEDNPADVKPATWWLTKYKTRWFSDGSLQSGNPVIGAMIVNEIGRGTDLHDFDAWLETNAKKVEELTTAVFSAQPPSFFEFFDDGDFDIEAAKRGEVLFQANCSRCHGTYAKGWSNPSITNKLEQLKTTQVRYHEVTPVRNVGTDSARREAIGWMGEINDIAPFKNRNIVMLPTQGYVPPPLVGIFARWPYFHNGSAPTLCAVLTRASDRPKTYVWGDVLDPDVDFDYACNGYLEDPPNGYSEVYDTSVRGLSNAGHDEGIFLKDGKEIMTPADKLDLIKFLQTL